MINIEYKALGNYSSYCSYEPEDIHESEDPPAEFTRDELRMSMNRLKRIIWTIETYSQWLKDLRTFTYPNLSYLFYLGLIIFTIFYDNNSVLEWMVGSLIVVLVYYNPNVQIYMGEAIDIMGYREKWERLKEYFLTKN